MVESREDHDVSNYKIEEPELVDKDYPGGQDPAAEGSAGIGGNPGGPEVPDQGRTQAPGGLSEGLEERGNRRGAAGAANAEGDDAAGGPTGGQNGMPGGPASGTGTHAELEEEDIPDTSSDMPPGRKFGTPGITEGS